MTGKVTDSDAGEKSLHRSRQQDRQRAGARNKGQQRKRDTEQIEPSYRDNGRELKEQKGPI